MHSENIYLLYIECMDHADILCVEKCIFITFQLIFPKFNITSLYSFDFESVIIVLTAKTIAE